jgi:hypothetical protein
MTNELDGLEPLASVLSRDERWRIFGNRTLEQHHAYIAQFELGDAVPADVRQHFENARNTWLYASQLPAFASGSDAGACGGRSGDQGASQAGRREYGRKTLERVARHGH